MPVEIGIKRQWSARSCRLVDGLAQPVCPSYFIYKNEHFSTSETTKPLINKSNEKLNVEALKLWNILLVNQVESKIKSGTRIILMTLMVACQMNYHRDSI